MEKGDEFQTPNTLRTVAVLLNSVEKGLPKLYKKHHENIMFEFLIFFTPFRPKNQQDSIRKSCWSFFLDLLSTICVDVNQELIDVLIDSVFFVPGEPPMDEKIAIFVQNHLEHLSYLQSFVMKLILCQELEQKIKINTFFSLHIFCRFSTSKSTLVNIFDRINKWDVKQSKISQMKEHDFLILATNNFKVLLNA